MGLDILFISFLLCSVSEEYWRRVFMTRMPFLASTTCVGWQLLRKYGCHEKFTTMIESLHTGMIVMVRNRGEVSDTFL